MLIDSHCHIHWPDYPIDSEKVIENARQAGVEKIICVGTDPADSKIALEFAQAHDNVFASVGVHPHYADKSIGKLESIVRSVRAVSSENGFAPGSMGAPAPNQTRAADVFTNKGTSQNNTSPKLVAIGEIGLDYYRNHSSPESQKKILREQIELALKYDLPIIFHVRDAFDDFWPIFDEYQGIRGVLHSFTDTIENAKKGMDRGLYIGLNGISTFTKDDTQKAMYAALPLNKILLETDAPYLTPSPFRGKVEVNEPAFVKEIAEHFSAIHQISFDEVVKTTTANARALFKL